MFASFLKHVSHYCYMRWGQKCGKFTLFSTETTVHNNVLMLPSAVLKCMNLLTSFYVNVNQMLLVPNTSPNKCLPLTAISYRPCCEFSSMFQC